MKDLPESDTDPAVGTTCGEELQLEAFGETPITKTTLKRSKQKVDKVTTMMQKAMINERSLCSDCEIVSQLREKFLTATRSEKM